MPNWEQIKVFICYSAHEPEDRRLFNVVIGGYCWFVAFKVLVFVFCSLDFFFFWDNKHTILGFD